MEKYQDIAKSRAILDLLEAVAKGENHSQRSMALEFGMAVGLINSYLKVCLRKGFIKIRRTASRRHAYLLTHKGSVERFRLMAFLLSMELERFRRLRSEYTVVFQEARRRGWRRVVLAGVSDLAEIAAICSLETGIVIAASVDPQKRLNSIAGSPVLERLADISVPFDGVLITDLLEPRVVFETAVAAVGYEKVLAPIFFDLGLRETESNLA